MKSRAYLIVISILILSLQSCSIFSNSEQTISLQQLPEKIRTLAEQTIGTCQIVEVEKETQWGRTLYSVNYLIDGVEWELELSESGEIISHEQEL